MSGGGSERQLLNLARYLDRDRFSLSLYLLYAEGALLPRFPVIFRLRVFGVTTCVLDGIGQDVFTAGKKGISIAICSNTESMSPTIDCSTWRCLRAQLPKGHRSHEFQPSSAHHRAISRTPTADFCGSRNACCVGPINWQTMYWPSANRPPTTPKAFTICPRGMFKFFLAPPISTESIEAFQSIRPSGIRIMLTFFALGD